MIKKSLFKKVIISAISFVLLITTVISSDTATVVEVSKLSINHNGSFTVASVDPTGKFLAVESFVAYDAAVAKMNMLHSSQVPHVVITQIKDPKNAESTYTKIVGQPAGGFAQSYPYRDISVEGDTKGPMNTLRIYKNESLTNNIGYIPAHYQMKVIEIKPHKNTFIAQVEIAGLIGWVDLNKIDLIPRSHMSDISKNGGIPLIMGGYESYYKGDQVEAPYSMIVKPEHFEVTKVGSYNEIKFKQYRTYPGMSDGSPTFGIAPDWLPVGNYFSDDHIKYYKDVDRKQPVMNGSAVGEYFSYFQWLPVNSTTLHSGDTFRNYLISLNKTDSIYLNETQAFVENGNKYGMNPLLVFAQANLESGYGTSKYAKDRFNLFGWGAVDSNPDNADRFTSVSNSIARHMKENLKDYMNPTNWKHYGFGFGNMSSGISVKYASDPIYGMKIANIAFSVDKANGFKDYNNYKLTKLANNTATKFTTEPGKGTTVYSSKNHGNQIVANLGTSGNFIKTNRTVSNRGSNAINLLSDFVYFANTGTITQPSYGPKANPLPTNLVTVTDVQKQYTFTSAQSLRTEWNDISRILDTVPGGTKINGYQTTNGYVYFEYNGFKGYVKESLITAGSTIKPLSKSGKYKVIGDGSLRLREQANTSSKVLASIPKGTVISVIDVGDANWVKVTFEGKTGFVHYDYLKLISLDSEVKPDPKPDPKPTFAKGDVNADGNIDAGDINAVKRHILGISILNGDKFKMGDVNGDGRIDAGDINTIKRHILGISEIK